MICPKDNVRVLSHLAIGIARNLVEGKITLEVVAYSSPGVYSLHILLALISLISLLYTVGAITFSRLPDNVERALRANSPVYFV